MHDDPVFRLGKALTAQQLVAGQVIAVASFLCGCAAWRISPLHEPEPFTGIAIIVGSVGLAAMLTLAWWMRTKTTRCADDLILAGFRNLDAATPVGSALANRIDSIESRRCRRRLARGLRWRLQLAEGTIHPSPGYVRASVVPPLGSSERRVLLEERSRVSAMITCLERTPVDPQALVLLWRVITTPPSLDIASESSAADELHRMLLRASTLIGTGE
jgi:hypothetical protein